MKYHSRVLLLVLSVLAWTVSAEKKLDLRVLVITGGVALDAEENPLDNPRLYDAELLMGMNVAFDTLYIGRENRDSSPSVDLNLRYPDDPNHGRYSAIIRQPATYPFEDGWAEALRDDQLEELKAYEEEFNVRRLEIGVFPRPEVLMTDYSYAGTENGDCPNREYFNTYNETITIRDCPSVARLSEEGQALNYVLGDSAVFDFGPDDSMDGTVPFYNPAAIDDPQETRQVQAVVTFDAYKDYPETVLVSVFNDGKSEIMSNFMGVGWLIYSSTLALHHYTIDWVTKGAFLGSRRLHLGVQIDDLFLRSQSFTRPSLLYRSTRYDLKRVWEFQEEVLANPALPPNSYFKVEMGYNHNGMFQEADVSYQFVRRYENAALEEQWIGDMPCAGWRAPIDGEEPGDNEFNLCGGDTPFPGPAIVYHRNDTIPEEFDENDVRTWIRSDPVWHYAMTDEVQEYFHWITHTFSHLEMDNITEHDASQEIDISMRVQRTVGLDDHPYHSSEHVITPRISGLFNGYALRAMDKLGIISIVDDKSTGVTNFNYPWHGWRTTYERNGHDGMYVNKRDPAEVYFQAIDVEDNEAIYFANEGHYLTHDENMRRESIRVSRLVMLNFLDMSQFHQANLRVRNGTGCSETVGPDTEEENCSVVTAKDPLFNNPDHPHSLLTYWIAFVLARLYPLMGLPLRSWKQSEVYEDYLLRESQYACNPTATMDIADDGTITNLNIIPGQEGTCRLRLTGFYANAVESIERYGPDTTTYYNLTGQTNTGFQTTWNWKNPPRDGERRPGPEEVLPNPLASWTRSVDFPDSADDDLDTVVNSGDGNNALIIGFIVVGCVIALSTVAVALVIWRRQRNNKADRLRSSLELLGDRI
eukprot:Clim_evm63s232 gene=Clim_evmTU63s232